MLCKTIVRINSICVFIQFSSFKRSEALQSQTTLFDRLDELYFQEENMWFHRLQVPLAVQETLDFVQHLTRTQLHPISQLPPPSSSNPSSHLKAVITRRLEHLIAASNCRPVGVVDMMECAYRALVEVASRSQCHADFQTAYGGKIETFFKRTGYASLFKTHEDDGRLSEGIWEPNSEVVLDDQGMIRFNIRTQLAWQLRAKCPLKPVRFNNNLY